VIGEVSQTRYHIYTLALIYVRLITNRIKQRSSFFNRCLTDYVDLTNSACYCGVDKFMIASTALAHYVFFLAKARTPQIRWY
jgi:hypothetical protein